MSLLDVLLLIGALVFYFHFLLPGFLVAAAFAGLMVWHFLVQEASRPDQYTTLSISEQRICSELEQRADEVLELEIELGDDAVGAAR